MKFSHANRFFSINENYNPPSNYYSGPSDPKFNTIYKITFGNNLENLEENKNLFGKQNRFNYQNKQRKNITPGPGHYEKNINQFFQQQQKKETLQIKILKQDLLIFRQKQVPTIPHADHQIKREQNLYKKIVGDQEIEKLSKIIQASNVGPTSYYPNFQQIKPKSVGGLINPAKKQIQKRIKQQETNKILYLGQLNESQQIIMQIDKNNKRINNINQKKNLIEQYNKHLKSKKDNRDDLQEIFKSKYQVDDETENNDQDNISTLSIMSNPEPGQYYNEECYSTFKFKKKPIQFQCFESKQQRFENQEQKIQIPGVGKYNINPQSKKYQFALQNAIRFKNFNKCSDPGPCEYFSNLNDQICDKNIQKLNFCAFGSSQKRFLFQKMQNSNNNQNNLNIYQENIQKIHQSKRNKKQYNIFIKNCNDIQKYQKSIQNQQEIMSNFIQYVPQQQDNKINQDQKIIYQQKLNDIQELKGQSSVGSSAFRSKVKRFLTNQNEYFELRGPGVYNIKRSLISKTFNAKKTLFGQEERKYNSENNNHQIAPGDYNYDISKIKQKIVYDINF